MSQVPTPGQTRGLGIDTSHPTQEAPEVGEDTFEELGVVAKNELLHEGNKLYWKINRTVDFRVYQ